MKNKGMNMETGRKTKLQVIYSEFCKRFRKDVGIAINQAIPLSKNILDSGKRWLSLDATDEETFNSFIK